MKSLPPGCHDSNFLPLYSLLPMRMQSWGMKSSSLPSTMLQSCCSSEMQTTLLHPSSYNPEVQSRTIDNESIFDKRILDCMSACFGTFFSIQTFIIQTQCRHWCRDQNCTCILFTISSGGSSLDTTRQHI